MQRWTKKQLDNYDPVEFACEILKERYIPLQHHTNFAGKLNQTILDLRRMKKENEEQALLVLSLQNQINNLI